MLSRGAWLAPRPLFLDGDHSREGVRRDLKVLRAAVPDGAILLLHDYADRRNADPAEPELGVGEAVAESWVESDCDFGGDLASLDSWRMRYVHYPRLPLARRFRATRRCIGRSIRRRAGARRREIRG